MARDRARVALEDISPAPHGSCAFEADGRNGPGPSDPDAVIVTAALQGNANAYASLQRYLATAERSYYKAKRELEQER